MGSSTSLQPDRPAPPEIVESLLDHLRAGTTDLCAGTMALDAAIFCDPAIAVADRDLVLGRVPIIAAHGSELPEPNDFVAKRLPRNDVVVTRQVDGSVKTFLNMCRHRGGRLVDETSGKCRRFSCPYHGWSYDTGGHLVSVTFPDSFGVVDSGRLGLIELPTEERHGFVWVIDDPDASIDVAAWLGGGMDELLASYRLDRFQSYQPRSFDEPVNWKVMHDAFLDGYHIKFVHPDSASRQIHTNVYFTEELGRHYRFASPRRSLDPWLAGNADGPPSLKNVVVTHFVSPNCTLLQLDDNYQVLTFYPISDDPFASRMEMRVLTPLDDEPRYSPEEWTAKWDKNWHVLEVVLAGEDFPVLRNIQRGYANRSASSAVLGRNEVLNQAFHREIAELRSGSSL